ncbi:hypothetical protein HOD08_04815 [bacterium]|nr:hypothetical protein [bacterium]
MKRIFLAALCLVSTTASGMTYVEKAHLTMTSPGWHAALRETLLDQQLALPVAERINGKLQFTGFYHEVLNEKNLAEYFGMSNAATGKNNDYIGVDPTNSNELLHTLDLIHNHGQSSASDVGLRDRVQMRPWRRAFGGTVEYHQKLGGACSRLGLRFGMPFAESKTRLSPKSILDIAREATLPGTTTTVSLLDFLAGNVSGDDSAGNAQSALAKMKVTTDDQKKLDLGNPGFSVHFRFCDRPQGYVDGSAGVIIPLGTEPTGEFKFEPTVGNGRHWGFSCGVSAHAALSETCESRFEIVARAKYRYLFAGDETRAPYFQYAGGSMPAWPHYILMGKQGSTTLFPAANVLTKKYRITPGHQLDVVGGFAYDNSRLRFEIGGSILFRDQEKAEVIEWDNDTYAVADYSYDSSSANTFDYQTDGYSLKGLENAPAAERAINSTSLLMSSIQTPRTIVYAMHASMGYAVESCKYPIVFGAGFGRDVLASNNAWAKEWIAWANLGANF